MLTHFRSCLLCIFAVIFSGPFPSPGSISSNVDTVLVIRPLKEQYRNGSSPSTASAESPSNEGHGSVARPFFVHILRSPAFTAPSSADYELSFSLSASFSGNVLIVVHEENDRESQLHKISSGATNIRKYVLCVPSRDAFSSHFLCRFIESINN